MSDVLAGAARGLSDTDAYWEHAEWGDVLREWSLDKLVADSVADKFTVGLQAHLF